MTAIRSSRAEFEEKLRRLPTHGQVGVIEQR
jgi:hypothetical protein